LISLGRSISQQKHRLYVFIHPRLSSGIGGLRPHPASQPLLPAGEHGGHAEEAFHRDDRLLPSWHFRRRWRRPRRNLRPPPRRRMLRPSRLSRSTRCTRPRRCTRFIRRCIRRPPPRSRLLRRRRSPRGAFPASGRSGEVRRDGVICASFRAGDYARMTNSALPRSVLLTVQISSAAAISACRCSASMLPEMSNRIRKRATREEPAKAFSPVT